MTPELEIVIEIPRGSFLKRGFGGRIDFISPLPCPYNYGCAPAWIGLEGDLLDAIVLGPRLALGTRIRTRAWGAVTMRDRDMIDDKMICSDTAPTPAQREEILRFFQRYARLKGWLNMIRNQPGRNACEGWISAEEALARAQARDDRWEGPLVRF